MDVLLEDRVLLDVLEFGLEVLQSGSVGGRVGSAASIGEVEAFILDFFTFDTPVYGSQLYANEGVQDARL